MKHHDADVVVIGGGHAGCEAATAAARSGASTILVTLKTSDLGVMSCNPAFGGLGKGHLVREIDALDGVMGKAADEAGIQFRLLNRKKGPAVQGPRAQADRNLYAAAVTHHLGATDNLQVCEGEVVDVRPMASGFAIELSNKPEIQAKTVVLTTGTFLNGLVHIGPESFPAGRMGDRPSIPLAERDRKSVV